MLLGDELPTDVFALGGPCWLDVTVTLELVSRGEKTPTPRVWPGRLRFTYQNQLDLVSLFGAQGPRRDFTVSLTGALTGAHHRARSVRPADSVLCAGHAGNGVAGVRDGTAEDTPTVINAPFYVRLVVANNTSAPHDLWLRLNDGTGRSKALPGPPTASTTVPVPSTTASSDSAEPVVACSLESNIHLGSDGDQRTRGRGRGARTARIGDALMAAVSRPVRRPSPALASQASGGPYVASPPCRVLGASARAACASNAGGRRRP